jgi:hypothetical protein
LSGVKDTETLIMETIEKSVEVLNNLLEINNDRNAGFAHAGQGLDVNDDDLRTLFSELKEQSRMMYWSLVQQ